MKEYKLGDLVLITTIELTGLKKEIYIFNKIKKVKMFNEGYYLIDYYQSISNPFKKITSTGEYLKIEYLA